MNCSEKADRYWEMSQWDIEPDEWWCIDKALREGLVVIVRERKGQKWLNGEPKKALVAFSVPENSCQRAFHGLFMIDDALDNFT